MTITLEKIKEEHSKLAEMIAAFEAQAKASRLVSFPSVEIELKEGEHYAGVITGKNGEPSYHVILLPGQATDINWKDAQDWAKKSGGELPTRREQSLLFANLKEQFEERYYWSSEAYASGSVYAWVQYFYNGGQGYSSVGTNYRARAVRRLVFSN